MSRTLYEIGADLSFLEAMLIDAEGEITDDAAGREIERWFDSLGAERDREINRYCAMIKEIEARHNAREWEAQRLRELAAEDAATTERFKRELKAYLEKCGIQKLQTAHFKLSVAQNGGPIPLILPEGWEAEPASAPEAFQRRVIQLDKAAIREAIRNDGETHGATMGERGTHLRIR